ncbi:hypothetical protein evm_014727 [Chilo suppressalis]|nr:hypothetical protein evm_014727 [Chilo suppressalis]
MNVQQNNIQILVVFEQQIQELIEAVCFNDTQRKVCESRHPPPKGVLLYGPREQEKPCWPGLCCNRPSSTFLKLAGPQTGTDVYR